MQADVRSAVAAAWRALESRNTLFDKIAERLDCHGEYVEKEDQIGPAMERAYAS